MHGTPLKILLLLLSVFTSITTHFTEVSPDNTCLWGGEKKSGLNGCNSTLSFPQFHKCYLLLNSVPSLYPAACQIAWAQPLQAFDLGYRPSLLKEGQRKHAAENHQDFLREASHLKNIWSANRTQYQVFLLSGIALIKGFAFYSKKSHNLHILTSRLCSLSYVMCSFHSAPKPSQISWNRCYLCNPYKLF